MFGTILISVCTLIHIYVFWRAATVPLVSRHVPLTLFVLIGLFLWALLFMGRLFHHSGTGTLTAAIELFGMLWLGTLFLLFISLLAMDVITGFGFLLPRWAPSLRGWALLAGAVLSVIALVQGLRPPVMQRYEVHLAGLSDEMDGKVLVAMSDLHLGSLIGKRWLAGRSRCRFRRKPDAFCPYSRRSDLALRLSDPPLLSAAGRALRGKRHACHRLPRNRNVGTPNAPVAPRRNSAHNASQTIMRKEKEYDGLLGI